MNFRKMNTDKGTKGRFKRAKVQYWDWWLTSDNPRYSWVDVWNYKSSNLAIRVTKGLK